MAMEYWDDDEFPMPTDEELAKAGAKLKAAIAAGKLIVTTVSTPWSPLSLYDTMLGRPPTPETLDQKLARHFPPLGEDGLLPEGW
jgi:hypothetical protein